MSLARLRKPTLIVLPLLLALAVLSLAQLGFPLIESEMFMFRNEDAKAQSMRF